MRVIANFPICPEFLGLLCAVVLAISAVHEIGTTCSLAITNGQWRYCGSAPIRYRGLDTLKLSLDS